MTRQVPAAAVAAIVGVLPSGCVVASSSSGTGDFGFLLLFPVVFGVLVFGLSRAGRRRRRAPHVDESGVNAQLLRAEVSVLADDVVRLEPQVTLHPEARDDFEAATQRYRVAQAALDYTDAPVDLIRVQRVVDEANWSMTRARATLEGRPPPAPPAILQRPGRHGEPAVQLDDREQPVYANSSASFRSGWFGLGGGLLGGLLLGSVASFEWDDELADPGADGTFEA